MSAGGHPLLHLAGAELTKACARPGRHDVPEDRRLQLDGGGLALVYLWVPLESARVPAALDHRIVVKQKGEELTVPDVRVAVRNVAPRVFSPPLRGGGWLAGNGPSNKSPHRLTVVPLGGHARIPQRFAVDWVKVGADGKTFTGDPTRNTSYAAYGAEALAVGDGVVTEVKDGIRENVPEQDPAVPITLETVAGNHVIVDPGGGAFGMWAHLQPGSVRVKVGERVRRGQVLALVGNSGNSSEPHLHFHLTDAPSTLAAEGIPYAFESFEGEGPRRRRQAREGAADGGRGRHRFPEARRAGGLRSRGRGRPLDRCVDAPPWIRCDPADDPPMRARSLRDFQGRGGESSVVRNVQRQCVPAGTASGAWGWVWLAWPRSRSTAGAARAGTRARSTAAAGSPTGLRTTR